MNTERIVIVVGAGASGLMAAGRAAELGARVILLEKTERAGKKLLLTAHRRGNITNTRELEGFPEMYGRNGRFLRSAFGCFFRDDLLDLLRRYGVETCTEIDGRVFPVSEDAGDVVSALERYGAEHGVERVTGAAVTRILAAGRKLVGVETESHTYPCCAAIMATGGASYPHTGSNGDGYRLAASLGHTVVELRPALVPVIVHEIDLARSMQGVSLASVRLTAYQCPADQIDHAQEQVRDWGRGSRGRRPAGPVIESRQGDLMITHFGLGGPATLSMSLAIVDALGHGPVSVSIDLFPGIEEKQMHERLQAGFDRHGKRGLRHILADLVPPRMVEPLLGLAGITAERQGHEITAEERGRLTGVLKSIRFNIERPLSMASAMVTAGGVSLDEIDPHTMGSRLVERLYFCGEVMDIDGDTGGFNLQAAFSTGYLAGESAASTCVPGRA